MTCHALLLSLPLCLLPCSWAHDIALYPEVQGRTIRIVARYGHPGDYQPAALNKVLDLDAYDPAGRKVSCVPQLKLEGLSLVAPLEAKTASGGTWVLATRYDNGFFVKGPDGRSVATVKTEYPSATTSTHNIKYGKALVRIDQGAAGFAQVVGHRLELIPRQDPASLKPGDKLPVEVRFAGQPLANAGVEIGDGVTPMKEESIQRYQTNAQGIALVPITRRGLQVVAVDHKVRSAYPAVAAEDAYTATLTFTLE